MNKTAETIDNIGFQLFFNVRKWYNDNIRYKTKRGVSDDRIRKTVNEK
jgi:hypothetical protein